MILSKMKYVAVVLFAALLLASSAHAQGRVFTNEDIATTPPPAAVTPPLSDAAVAPGAAPAVAIPAAGMSTPVADLNRAVTLQATLMDLFGEFNGKALETSDAALKKRWTDMSVCMSAVMQANQRTIEELEQVVPPEQRPKSLVLTTSEEPGEGSQPAAPPPPR